MKLSNIKKIRGQSMSEYLVVVALVAVATIAGVTFFGGAARNQLTAVTQEIAGIDGAAKSDLAGTSQAADSVTDSDDNRNMDTFSDADPQ